MEHTWLQVPPERARPMRPDTGTAASRRLSKGLAELGTELGPAAGEAALKARINSELRAGEAAPEAVLCGEVEAG